MKLRLLAGVAGVAASLALSAPAMAQTEPTPEISVAGSVALVSDYRFRGVSMTDKEMAIQGGFTVNHASGLYVGTWGSNLSGWGTFGGANMELDIYGGYSTEITSGLTADVGLTWYMYPGGFDNTDFAEAYVKLSGDLGPASVLVGAAYAPKQEAIGTWYNNGASAAAGVYDNPGDKGDNLYLWTDVSYGVPETGLTLKGHFGYSNGNKGLGPLATSLAPTGEYLDWMLGADYALGPVTLGVAYVDTDITNKESAYLGSGFRSSKNGSSISKATVVFSASASF